MGTVEDLEFEAIRNGIDQGTILLVDVREPHEFAAGHIPGSVSMPLSSFDPHELPDAAGKRIVFSCAAGVRSVRALMMAQAFGQPLDAHYIGGFKDWQMRGAPIAT